MKRTRTILAKIFSLLLLFGIGQIGISNAYFSDTATVTGNTVTAGYWGEPLFGPLSLGEPGRSLETNLDFYLMADELAVGFNISGISSFDSLEYTITYDSDTGLQGIYGTIDTNGADEIQREGLLLGTCTSGGTCTYHSGIKTVNIEVILHGPVERTLTGKIAL